jgi:pyridoxal phosphate enzyme (YggS family)
VSSLRHLAIPNLYVLETLCTIKTANTLQKSLPEGSTLNVYIQINTSSEESKSGVAPLSPNPQAQPDPNPQSEGLVHLAKHILEECPKLKLHGLMTIGAYSASTSNDKDGVNPDFDTLKATRTALIKALKEEGVSGAPSGEDELELSMGMSADFVEAVRMGSSGVRVGTRIFGERPKKVKVGDGEGVTK